MHLLPHPGRQQLQQHHLLPSRRQPYQEEHARPWQQKNELENRCGSTSSERAREREEREKRKKDRACEWR